MLIPVFSMLPAFHSDNSSGIQDTSDLVREIAKLHCSYTGPEPFYPREPDEEFEQSVKMFLEQRVAPADQPAGTEGKHPAPYRMIKPDKQNPVKRNRV